MIIIINHNECEMLRAQQFRFIFLLLRITPSFHSGWRFDVAFFFKAVLFFS